MLKSFKSIFQQLTINRTEDVCSTLLQNEKYNKLSDYNNEIYYKIKELLPDEHKHLMDDFAETETELECISIKTVYEQGLKDGIELKNILKIVS